MEWYVSVLKKYVDFSGRARRKEYWMFCLYNTTFTVVILFISAAVQVYALILLYCLVTLLPRLAVGVRRLHDIGKSAKWLSILLIPYIGRILLTILFCTEGELGPNEFGSNPKLAS